MIGSALGPYEISHKLGEGGMGAVYAARHQSIERMVAIKILHAQWITSKDLVQRFFNEARAAARIDHPGIVQVFDCNLLPDGTAYLIMELVKGENLASRLRKGRIQLKQLLQISWQVASALAAVHAVGIVHRDLKPDNILLSPDPFIDGGERIKILDFGIAKLSVSGSVQTRNSVVMGTPRYMSPEQCRGAANITDRSDVYSLGVMLFEMLSGQPLFESDGPNGYLFQHVTTAPPQLSVVAPTIPKGVADLTHMLLEKAPTDRPAMEQVARELQFLLESSTKSASAAVLPSLLTERKPIFPDEPITTLSKATSLRQPRYRSAARSIFWSAGALTLFGSTILLGTNTWAPNQILAPILGNAPTADAPSAAPPFQSSQTLPPLSTPLPPEQSPRSQPIQQQETELSLPADEATAKILVAPEQGSEHEDPPPAPQNAQKSRLSAPQPSRSWSRPPSKRPAPPIKAAKPVRAKSKPTLEDLLAE